MDMSNTSDVAPEVSSEAPVYTEMLKPMAVLQAINHPIRWQILQMLASGQTMTGTQMADALGKSPDMMNKNLRVMRNAGLLACALSADQRYNAYSIPAMFRRQIGLIDYGFCVLRIASAQPPVAKD